MNHRILREKLTQLQLGVVQRPVAGNLPGDAELLTGIDQDLLAIDHELVIAQVAAYQHVTALCKGADSLDVKGLFLEQSHLVRRGDALGDFAGIAAEASDTDVRVLLQVSNNAAGKLSGDTDDTNSDGHFWRRES